MVDSLQSSLDVSPDERAKGNKRETERGNLVVNAEIEKMDE